MTVGNPKHRSEKQVETIENIKTFYKSREKVIGLYNDYSKHRSEAKYKTKQGEGLKI